mmetsp:Transcript_31358/g.80392  ORF Transcript_31358/g.80392 Transcript_31358/m.80392 type:complete len:256 (+) Transcript_31358:558-1325(+)
MLVGAPSRTGSTTPTMPRLTAAGSGLCDLRPVACSSHWHQCSMARAISSAEATCVALPYTLRSLASQIEMTLDSSRSARASNSQPRILRGRPASLSSLDTVSSRPTTYSMWRARQVIRRPWKPDGSASSIAAPISRSQNAVMLFATQVSTSSADRRRSSSMYGMRGCSASQASSSVLCNCCLSLPVSIRSAAVICRLCTTRTRRECSQSQAISAISRPLSSRGEYTPRLGRSESMRASQLSPRWPLASFPSDMPM